jgi:hypothetical protein
VQKFQKFESVSEKFLENGIFSRRRRSSGGGYSGAKPNFDAPAVEKHQKTPT